MASIEVKFKTSSSSSDAGSERPDEDDFDDAVLMPDSSGDDSFISVQSEQSENPIAVAIVEGVDRPPILDPTTLNTNLHHL